MDGSEGVNPSILWLTRAFRLPNFRAYPSVASLADLMKNARVGNFRIFSEQEGLREDDREYHISLERQVEPFS